MSSLELCSSRLPAPRTRVEAFAFGGVWFELLIPEPALGRDLLAECRSFARSELGAVTSAGVLATARCALRFDPGLAFRLGDGAPSHARITHSPDGSTSVVAPRVRARVRPVGGHGEATYAVSASLQPSPAGALALLRTVSAALVQRHGGVSLHAVLADCAGQGVLLLGPSGAGKSTAMTLLREARCAANDHVVAAPRPDGRWVAWALPGGTPSSAEPSSAVCLPLRAAVRIRHGQIAPRVDSLRGIDAVFALRAAVETGDFSPRAEDDSLAAVTALAAALAVGQARTVLGSAWDTALHAWLSDPSQ